MMFKSWTTGNVGKAVKKKFFESINTIKCIKMKIRSSLNSKNKSSACRKTVFFTKTLEIKQIT